MWPQIDECIHALFAMHSSPGADVAGADLSEHIVPSSSPAILPLSNDEAAQLFAAMQPCCSPAAEVPLPSAARVVAELGLPRAKSSVELEDEGFQLVKPQSWAEHVNI